MKGCEFAEMLPHGGAGPVTRLRAVRFGDLGSFGAVSIEKSTACPPDCLGVSARAVVLFGEPTQLASAFANRPRVRSMSQELFDRQLVKVLEVPSEPVGGIDPVLFLPLCGGQRDHFSVRSFVVIVSLSAASASRTTDPLVRDWRFLAPERAAHAIR